jgi:hypothetical protein
LLRGQEPLAYAETATLTTHVPTADTPFFVALTHIVARHAMPTSQHHHITTLHRHITTLHRHITTSTDRHMA